MSTRKMVGLVLLALLIIAGFWGCHSVAYNQPANKIAVVQYVNGALEASYSPGPHWLWFGHVTYYPRRGQVDFDGKDDKDANDEVLHTPLMDIRFNDGPQCKMSGSLAWEMPSDPQQVIALHKAYHGPDAIERQIIVKNISKAAFVAGPMMSSAESYASRRNDLLSLVYDQVERGAFKTISRDVRVKDTLTGEEKTTRQVEVATDSKGQPIREDVSIIAQFGLHTFNLVIDGIQYTPVVEQQIATQQQAIMAVQTAIAKARTAEQDAITTEQQGKANAMKEKWDQEAIKAKEVTIAEKNLAVSRLTAMADMTNAVIGAEKKVREAELARIAAEATRAAQIALGEGEAKRAQLVMQANGALEQKLAAWTEVNKFYAKAMSEYRGDWVPKTVFGGASGGFTSGGGAADLMALLTVQTAKQLSLDMSMPATAHSTNSAAK